MADATPVRPDYVDGQFLDANDFTAEQQYHLAMLRRHHVGHHTAGTVVGLKIGIDKDTRDVFLGLGVGVDGLGRELMVTSRLLLPANLFPPGGPDAYDVELVYDRVSKTVSGRTQWIEQPRVEVTAPTGPGAGPPESSSIVTSFGPGDLPPDDPAVRAPLFVGQVRRPETAGAPPIIDQSGRRYVELIAAAISSPEGTARLELDGKDGPLALYATARPASGAGQATNQNATLTRRLVLDAGGQLIADGALDVGGALTIGTQLTLQPGPAQDGWGLQLISDSTQSLTELRIEMGSTSTPQHRRTVIGCWSQNGSFTALLTIEDGKVTVSGDLIVSGTIHAAGGIVPVELSPQANQFAAATMASGIGAAGGLIPNVTSGAFTPPGASILTQVEHTATQLVNHLKKDEANIENHAVAFVKQIEQSAEQFIPALLKAFGHKSNG